MRSIAPAPASNTSSASSSASSALRSVARKRTGTSDPSSHSLRASSSSNPSTRPSVRRRSLTNVLTRKLEAFAPLLEDDKNLLDDVIRSAREVGPREDLIREGDAPSDVHLILEGFA